MALRAIVDLSVTVSTVSGIRQRRKGSSSGIARDCRPQCHGIVTVSGSRQRGKGSSSGIARDCRPPCHGFDSIRYSSEK